MYRLIQALATRLASTKLANVLPHALLLQTPKEAFNFPILTINDGREVRPAIPSNRDMPYIHGPLFIAPLGDTPQLFHPQLWCNAPLAHQPALALHEPVDPFAIDQELVSKA